MDITRPAFQKYIFVCENKREEGECCAAKGSERIRELLKEAVQKKGLKGRIRVSHSGCLDVCQHGVNVLLMPDNIWFKHVAETDIGYIVERAMATGDAEGED